MELTELLEAGAAAERLGVSPSGLRRYASLYEQVHGELPRKVNTENRLYSGESLERLATARRLVEVKRYKSILEALEALEQGVQPEQIDVPGSGIQVVGGLQGDAALALLDELRAVRAELVALREDNRQMRAEMQKLAALPPADEVAGRETGLLTRLAARVERWLGRLRK
jgi:DNA-binding transcriptional MerR regulator